MLTYDLNKSGKLPKYDYLYQCIRDDIISGKIKSNEQLPSKRALANHLSIGLITVANAYEQLITEGYIVAKERVGYFVQELPEDFIKKNQEKNEVTKEEPEHEYFADFMANRISLKLFPISIWNQMLRQTLYDNSDTLFKTIPYNGIYELREAIADYLHKNRGMTVSPSQVIIGAGTEYLYSRLIQLFGRKSTFGFEESSFDKLSTICTAYGNPYNFIPIDESGLIVDELKKSATDIVHVSPSNHFPTGIVMPIKRRLELMEWAYESDNRYIIEDDYDSEFRYKGKYIAPIYTEDVNNKVIYMNTFSKTMVPSLRISYMVLPVDILERYKETMSFYSCTVSSFEQYALARFISGGYFERHINRIKNYYKKLRVQIINAIRESSIGEISEIVEHHSGTHFLLKVKTDLSEEEINEKCLENDLHILTYADYIKDDTDSDKSMTLVINYAGINPERIDDVIKRIERVFE